MIRKIGSFAFKIIIFLMLIFIALVVSFCMQDRKDEIPMEGDVVVWKHGASLIVKAILGPRREHVIVNPKVDSLIYEPKYEKYLGQFPIDYKPKCFSELAKEEYVKFESEYGNRSHGFKKQHYIEFNLMLHGSEFGATDRGVYSSEALDDINQVKVKVYYAGNVNRTSSLYENIKEGDGIYDSNMSSEYKMDCYKFSRKRSDTYSCYGKSNYDKDFGALVSVYSDGRWVEGYSIEPIYGGIKVYYRMDKSNIENWKEVDSAIWSLLECWNVSPLDMYNSTVN